MKHHFVITTHYFEDDTTFSGDYASVEVSLNSQPLRSYGDHTDQGRHKAEAFVDGCLFAITETTGLGVDVKVERREVADYVG